MLLIVTVVCEKDVDLAVKRAAWMTHMGQQPTHDILLINDGSVGAARFSELEALHRPLFRSVFTRRFLDRPDSTVWPYPVNHAWRTTTAILAGWYGEPFDSKPYHSWFFFEPDVTPLARNWAPWLEEKYVTGRAPFCGYVHITTMDNGTGVEHMNGAGVYPMTRQFYPKEVFLSELQPWDVAGLRGGILPMTTRLTVDEYAMAFGTVKYTRAGAMIHYEELVKPGEAKALQLRNQLFHHGCKDGSLMDILLAGITSTPSTVVSVPNPAWKPQDPPPILFSQSSPVVVTPPIIRTPGMVYDTHPPHYSEGAKVNPAWEAAQYHEEGNSSAIVAQSQAPKPVKTTDPALAAQIKADFESGMVFKAVMKKHKLNPAGLGKIRKELGI